MVLTTNREYQFETMLRNGYQQLTIDGAGQIQTTKSGEIENAIPFGRRNMAGRVGAERPR